MMKHRINKKTTKEISVTAGMLGAGLLLTGCGQAQDAIDQAQALVSTAQVLAQACSEASVAWEPGASIDTATSGLESALGNLNEALTADPTLPGAATLLTQLESALGDLQGAQDTAAAAASTAAIQTACSLIGG
jgi:hypothetical protein